jgi:hypothetical protein
MGFSCYGRSVLFGYLVNFALRGWRLQGLLRETDHGLEKRNK